MTCSARGAIFGNQPDKITVNGIVIPRDAIARETQHHPAPKPIAAWRAAARALAVRELLLQEARSIGIDPLPLIDADGRRETEEEALIRSLVEREIKVPEPDEITCRRYYDQNRGRFRSPTIHEAAHILFVAPQADTEAFANARHDADSVLAELRRRPECFADLARRYSACPSAAQGGELGQILDGQTTPEFERALFELAPGSISKMPVATRYGLHIIRLDRRIEGRDLPFEFVAVRIADYLRESVARRATAQYIARLVSRATLTGLILEDGEAHRVN